jgi:hypothetical protein
LRGILENTEYSLEIPVAKHRGWVVNTPSYLGGLEFISWHGDQLSCGFPQSLQENASIVPAH